jgi:hypothetical protein
MGVKRTIAILWPALLDVSALDRRQAKQPKGAHFGGHPKPTLEVELLTQYHHHRS